MVGVGEPIGGAQVEDLRVGAQNLGDEAQSQASRRTAPAVSGP